MNDKKQLKEEKTFDFGVAIALGISLGLAFGTALGNGPLGMVAGLLLATMANAYHERRQGKKGATASMIILVTGSLVVFLIVLLTTGCSA